ELVALVVVELLDRADQAHVAFLDQVEEGHAATDVLLRDRHDQPQVGLGQPLLGFICALVALGQPVPRDAIRLERLSAHARSFAVSSETRPISFRYMRTGSSRETESIISMSRSISSSICSTSSKSFSPSVTSIPISLNAAKMRKIWSGSASISGKPWRTSSGVR